MANAKDFFLPEVTGNYPVFRKPLNTAVKVERLIDGLNVFQSQEEAILAATDTILFVTWAFDPTMPVVSSGAKRVAKNWGQLLLTAAAHASVKILITDKDPIFQAGEHKAIWFSYRDLVTAAAKRGVDPADFQVVVSRHPADWPLRLAGGIAAGNLLDAMLAAAKGKLKGQVLADFQNAPGLWGLIDPVAGKTLKPPVASIPGTHHAKFLIIDETIAYVGGINHTKTYIDTQRHDAPASPLYQWHDGALKLQGKIVADVVDAGFQMWNELHPLAAKYVADANAVAPSGLPPLPVSATTDLKPIGPVGKRPRGVGIGAQVWRTVCDTIVADQPSTICTDIAQGYLQAIGLAERFVYIENQYLRDAAMANALIARALVKKDLNVVILLPDAAEEVILAQAAGGSVDVISQQGANLQHDIVERLKIALGPRLGVFSPTTPHTLSIPNPTTKAVTTVRRIIYVHTKLMIVDDLFATLGSANANPRGFRLDTEMNLAWSDPGSVRGLRNELWREMLGEGSGADTWAPKHYAAKWAKIAAANAKLTGATGWQGFIVPYDNSTSFGPVPAVIVPTWLT